MRTKAGIIAVVIVTAFLSGGWLLERGLSSPSLGATGFGPRLFDDVLGRIERFYVDTISDGELYDKAMVGMLQELHDPNTLYLKPERVRRLEERNSGNYAGIGISVEVRDRFPTITGTRSGSPAEHAGLRVGDRIVQLDGRATVGWTPEETIRSVRGEPGTILRLEVDRPGVATALRLDVRRDEIHRQSVAREALVRDGIGFIDLNIFSDSTEVELRRAIDSLRAVGMKSLILDVRGNPGGIFSQGVGVADLFLDANDTIVTMRGRGVDSTRVYTAHTPQLWPGMPLVMLVDEGSASASEILAGALQDHDRAVLVGRTTFGKGSAQELFPTSTGGALKLTIARWYTPAGRSIDRLPPSAADTNPSAQTPVARTPYKTSHGRVVYAGRRGGIMPDVLAGDTALSPSERALEQALGQRVGDFEDAMTAYAIKLKTHGAPSSVDFRVTPAMRNGLWDEMRARGISFHRSVYDAASGTIDRLLGRQIARYVFGPQAEAQRSVNEDEVIRTAIELLRGVRTTDELLQRAAARSAGM